MLRELGIAASVRVTAFIESNIHRFSNESLCYATAKLPAETQSRLKAAHNASAR